MVILLVDLKLFIDPRSNEGVDSLFGFIDPQIKWIISLTEEEEITIEMLSNFELLRKTWLFLKGDSIFVCSYGDVSLILSRLDRNVKASILGKVKFTWSCLEI